MHCIKGDNWSHISQGCVHDPWTYEQSYHFIFTKCFRYSLWAWVKFYKFPQLGTNKLEADVLLMDHVLPRTFISSVSLLVVQTEAVKVCSFFHNIFGCWGTIFHKQYLIHSCLNSTLKLFLGGVAVYWCVGCCTTVKRNGRETLQYNLIGPSLWPEFGTKATLGMRGT